MKFYEENSNFIIQILDLMRLKILYEMVLQDFSISRLKSKWIGNTSTRWWRACYVCMVWPNLQIIYPITGLAKGKWRKSFWSQNDNQKEKLCNFW